MSPLKVKFSGHVVLDAGVTLAFAPVTLNDGVVVGVGVKVAAGVEVGVGVGVFAAGQFSIKFACGEDKLLGARTSMRAQPLKLNPGAPSVHESGATFCVPAAKKVSACTGLSEPSLRTHL